jgi:hypothetical protein
VFRVLAGAIEATIPHRRFRDPEAPLSADSGADAPRTSIAKAYISSSGSAAATGTRQVQKGLTRHPCAHAQGRGSPSAGVRILVYVGVEAARLVLGLQNLRHESGVDLDLVPEVEKHELGALELEANAHVAVVAPG